MTGGKPSNPFTAELKSIQAEIATVNASSDFSEAQNPDIQRSENEYLRSLYAKRHQAAA